MTQEVMIVQTPNRPPPMAMTLNNTFWLTVKKEEEKKGYLWIYYVYLLFCMLRIYDTVECLLICMFCHKLNRVDTFDMLFSMLIKIVFS